MTAAGTLAALLLPALLVLNAFGAQAPERAAGGASRAKRPAYAMWVWEHPYPEELAGFCEDRGIGAVYISMQGLRHKSRYFHKLNTLLRAKGIRVFAWIYDRCDGSKEVCLHNKWNLVRRRFSAVAAHNQKRAPFDGLELDIRIEFKDAAKRKDAYLDYVDTLRMLDRARGDMEVRVSVSEAWVSESSETIRRLDGVIDAIDYQAYSRHALGSGERNMSLYLKRLTEHTRSPIYYGVLFDKVRKDPGMSFREEGTNGMFEQTRRLWRAADAPNLKGFAIHSYGSWREAEIKARSRRDKPPEPTKPAKPASTQVPSGT